MENYTLQTNESVLYKSEVRLVNKNEKYLELLSTTEKTELILTNLNLVFINKTKKLFSKEQVNVEIYPIEEIKTYNDVPQIKQNGSNIEIFFASSEKTIDFFSKHEVRKFVNKAYELLTGKSMTIRGADKVKGAVSLVNNTLGIDTVNTVKTVIENGVARTVLGGLGKKSSNSTKGNSTVKEAIGITRDFLGKKSDEESSSKSETKIYNSYNEQLETIKKMKELVDAGVLTQEEFNAKKKELLDL